MSPCLFFVEGLYLGLFCFYLLVSQRREGSGLKGEATQYLQERQLKIIIIFIKSVQSKNYCAMSCHEKMVG